MAEQKKELKKPTFVTVDQLKPGTHGHNLHLKVVSCTVVVEKTRTDNTKIRIAECLVGDKTASVILTARNEQIDLVQPGKAITVRNAKIEMFNKGFMRLVVDKWGKIEPCKEPLNFEVNANNLSNVEYELVTVESDN